MHKIIAIHALALAILLAAQTPLLAAPERITVEHAYVVGDSESRNEARANCLAEAKRKIAEQAGAYVEILSRTKNFQMDDDNVLSFTSALMRVTVEEERMEMDDQSLKLFMQVTGEVDPEEVKARLDDLAERRLAAGEQQSLLQEAASDELQPREAAASSPDISASSTAEAAGQPVLAEASQTEAAPVRAADPRTAKARLTRSLMETTQLCAELTEPGMTRNEVERLLGEPRARKDNSRYSLSGAKYGHLWVVYRDDVVACVRSRLEYRRNAGGEAHCEGFAVNFVKR